MFKGNIFAGLGYLFEAFGLMRTRALRPYVLIPLLINMMVFVGFGWQFYLWLDSGTNWLLSFVPDWMAWLTFLVMPAVVLVFLMAVFFLFNYVANIVAAPFNGLLAEKVCEQVSPGLQPFKETNLQLAKRTLAREVQKLKYYLPRLLGLAILSWIPIVNFAAPVLWFMFTAWMVALQYVDFAADNQGRSLEEVKAFLRQRTLSTLSLGALLMMVLTVPILNFIVIPLAVIAGSLYWQRNQEFPLEQPAIKEEIHRVS